MSVTFTDAQSNEGQWVPSHPCRGSSPLWRLEFTEDKLMTTGPRGPVLDAESFELQVAFESMRDAQCVPCLSLGYRIRTQTTSLDLVSL